MLNISDLVGTLLQSGMSKSSSNRLKNAFETDTGKSSGGLGGLLGGLGGGDLGGALAGMLGGGGGANLGGMLQSVLGEANQALGGKQNLALGGLAALAGAVLGGGGKSVKGAMGGGAMAMLAAMAFKALKGSGQSEPAIPLGLREPETEDEVRELENNAELVFRSMINAAKSDGQIGPKEIERISGKLDETDLDPEAREFILAEMGKPIDVESLAAAAANQPELGVQLYAAALMTIEVDTPNEKAYMQHLADQLGLTGDTVGQLEKMMGMRQ